MDEKNTQKLKKLLTLMDSEAMTQDEFFKQFQMVMEIFKSMKMANEKLISQMMTMIENKISEMDKMHNDNSSTMNSGMATMQKEMMDYCKKMMSTMEKQNQNEINFIHDKVISLRDVKNADESKIVQDVLNQIKLPEPKDVILDDAVAIRNKLETLKGEERLDKSAIKGLEELLKELEIKIQNMGGKTSFVGGMSSRGTVKAYDISTSLNGVLKTFSLPSFWRIISVHSSSFPNAFRETIDYTVNTAASTITFTSEIDASTALSSGNTIIIVYAES